MLEDDLKSQWLHSAVRSLVQARKRAGLTQAEVAERMGTQQAAVARLEKDTRGSMSFRTYVRYAMACGMGVHGMVPLDVRMVPLVWAKLFYEENPLSIPLTQRNLLAWNTARIRRGTNVVLDPQEWQVDF